MNAMQALGRLVGTIAVAREIDAQLPAQLLHSLLEVALQPGLTMQELSERTGLSQSSCSRNMAALGKWHRLGVPGHNLVETVDDPTDRRRKVMLLNARGRERVSLMLAQLYPEYAPFDLDRTTAKAHIEALRASAMRS